MQPSGSLALRKANKEIVKHINNNYTSLCQAVLVIRASPTRNVLEVFHTFVHGLVDICNIALQLLGVYGRQRVIEPALVPTHPIRGGGPQVRERLEVLHQLLQPIILTNTFTVHCHKYIL